MGNENKSIPSKSIYIGKRVGIFNAVVSIEFRARGIIICFQIFLHENQFQVKYIFGELSRT